MGDGDADLNEELVSKTDNAESSWASKSTALWRKSLDGVRAVWVNRPIFWRICFVRSGAVSRGRYDRGHAGRVQSLLRHSEKITPRSEIFGSRGSSRAERSAVSSQRSYTVASFRHRRSRRTTFLFFCERFCRGRDRDADADFRYMPKVPGMISVFVASFLFFFFSTPPKIGFQTLLQGLVVKTSKAATIFGAIGPIVMVTDSLVIFLMTLGFEFFKRHYGTEDGFQYALWTMASIYLLHGCFEVLLGPTLVLSSLEGSDDAYGALEGDDVDRRTPKESTVRREAPAFRTREARGWERNR